MPVDMVVLMGAMEPQAGAKEFGIKCGISCSMAGWYTERHPKLDPVATMTDGVFVAGVCQGPKDIPASVAQGAAAAARDRRHDQQGRGDHRADRGLDRRGALLRLPDLQQHVPLQRHRVRRGEGRRAASISALCKGCGTCVAACPAGVITGAHFNNEQIFAEIDGILWDARPRRSPPSRRRRREQRRSQGVALGGRGFDAPAGLRTDTLITAKIRIQYYGKRTIRAQDRGLPLQLVLVPGGRPGRLGADQVRPRTCGSSA